MMSRTKVSLLALVAMAAIGATSAASAQATGLFTAQNYPATMTGTDITDHVFKFGMWSVTCKVATLHGELAGASSELTLDPAYGECKTNNGRATEIAMTSCDYTLHAGETLAADEVGGSLDVTCAEAGDGIDLVVPFNGCKVTIPAQSGLEALTFTDNTMAEDFDIDFNLVEIEYQQNAQCFGGAMAAANGEYIGKSTMQAEVEELPIGTTVD
jgi:hypothetical protein